MENKEVWTFTAEADGKLYHLATTDLDEKHGYFTATPFKLENHIFIALRPDRDADEMASSNVFYQIHNIPAHSFIQLVESETGITLRLPSYDWLDDYLEEHPEELKHERMDGGFVVVTATTDEQQAFWLKHMNTLDAFYESPMQRATSPTNTNNDSVDQ